MKGAQIKDLLQNIRLNLVNVHGLSVEYTESHRGVPYLIVRFYNNYTEKYERYNLVFFGRYRFFRLFHVTNNNTHVNLKDREQVVRHLTSLRDQYKEVLINDIEKHSLS